jgi:hypothetical protein
MRIIDSLMASMIPIVLIMLAQIAVNLPFISCCMWPVMLALYLWMGYGLKAKGFGMADSAVVGAIAAIVAGIVYVVSQFLVSIILNALGLAAVTMTSESEDAVIASVLGTAGTMTGGLIGTVCIALLFPVCGAIISAIGYYIAVLMKK